MLTQAPPYRGGMRVWVVLVFLAAGPGCAGGLPTPSPATTTAALATTNTASTAAPDGSAENPFPTGESVRLGAGWSLKVLREAWTLHHTEPNRPAKSVDALVVAVDLELSYSGQGESFAMEALADLTAVGPSRRLYHYYRGHCADDDLLWQLESLTAGGRTAGQVCFIVDAADAGRLVMFLDVSSDRDDRTFLSLG